MTRQIVIVGNPGDAHIGRHLVIAAHSLGFEAELLDVAAAWGGPSFVRKFLWGWDHRPYGLNRFGQYVISRCEQLTPDVVIVTGISPPSARVLCDLAGRQVRVVNFLTDDPFNPAHRAGWFHRALPDYEVVFTPRRSNEVDLVRAGCRRVVRLPFAFDPSLHRKSVPSSDVEWDILFVGGGDTDRVPLVADLIKAGLHVALFGGFWDRDPRTVALTRGLATPDSIRTATTAAKVNLILVRRANRDGHVMRSFEAAACGGCLLVEETDEHREIFGDTVTYFGTADEMVRQARALLADPERRRASAEASHRRIVIDGKNTYADRLQTILQTVGAI